MKMQRLIDFIVLMVVIDLADLLVRFFLAGLGAETGAAAFGIAGGIISIPIAGSLKVLVEEYLENNRKIRTESDKPLTKLVKKLSGDSVS